jgi:hypothetical protein
MRLPTKRDYASTSMRAARRDPVLQDTNFVKSQAAQQRFYGLDPSAYMALGNAQSRAATAQGNVGLAMGTAALKVDAAVQKVDNILQPLSTVIGQQPTQRIYQTLTLPSLMERNTNMTVFPSKGRRTLKSSWLSYARSISLAMLQLLPITIPRCQALTLLTPTELMS